MNLKSGIYYGLKSLGTHIWSLIQEPRSVSEVRDAILKEYQVGRERCESDLLAVVEQLAAQGLIEVTNERPG
ncbi:MAG: PqqD family peptide modification chaperone [Acidobacteriota bacterium]